MAVPPSDKVLIPPARDVLRWKAIPRALRPHQWVKNILVLIPILAAHRVDDFASLISVLCAMIAFCLCASSAYVLNDLRDLSADRAHFSKCRRPFASGELSVFTGIALIPALLGAAVLISVFLTEGFRTSLALYYALTIAYSLALKGMAVIDALVLAGLYTLRIIAGAYAAGVPLSFWLLLFSIFVFLSLAFVKRFAELDALRRRRRLKALGREYRVEDLRVLQSLGVAAGYLSVVVLALYINSPEIEALYRRPSVIWLLCVLVLYWISRMWMIAQRGEMHDDPVLFALKDRMSLGTGVLAAIVVCLAL